MRESYKRVWPSMSMKITVLCGFVMFFVLRGTMWADNFGTSIQDFSELEKHQMLRNSGIGRKVSGSSVLEGSKHGGKAIQQIDPVEEANERGKPFQEAELVQEEEVNEVGGREKSTEEIEMQVEEEHAIEADSKEKSKHETVIQVEEAEAREEMIQGTKLIEEAEAREADSRDKSNQGTDIQVKEAAAREVEGRLVEEAETREVGDREKSKQRTDSEVEEAKAKKVFGRGESNQETEIRIREAEPREKSNQETGNHVEEVSQKTNIQVEEGEVRKNSTQERDGQVEGAEAKNGAAKSDQETDIQVEEEHAREVEPSKPYSLGPKVEDWDEQRRDWLQKYPERAKSVNGKPLILLVSGSQPKACVSAMGDHYHVKSMKNKIDYCRLHGMEFFYNMAFLDKVMTGFWAKLPLLRKLMLSHPEIEWFWWMDSDAVFTDMLFELPIERYTDYNMIVPGRNKEVYEDKHWVGLNTGSFLIRNCQWSLNILDAWATMGPDGKIREEAGRLLTKSLVGRPEFQADDQSALIYLLITQKDKWVDKVLLESSYTLHGFWLYLVDRYEELMEKYHPGLGDDRWPFVTHFVGCKPCSKFGDYPVEQCLKQMERAFNFADNQVLQMYGFQHLNIETPEVKWIGNQTASWPLQELYHHPSFNSKAF